MGSVKNKRGMKAVAAQAKNRLKSGYWARCGQECAVAADAAETKGTNPFEAEENVKKKYILRASERHDREKDETLYRRVRAILEKDENGLNPIGQLIDGDEFAAMDETGRQRYVLRLAAKFKELSERYYRERLTEV